MSMHTIRRLIRTGSRPLLPGRLIALLPLLLAIVAACGPGSAGPGY
jgi:hypothetical protein